VLALRITSLPGLVSAAGFGAANFNVLPPGVSMQGDRVLVDAAALLRQHGAAAILPFVDRAKITTTEGRTLVELDLRITRK
jgi:long-subunit fatty acid transport protein